MPKHNSVAKRPKDDDYVNPRAYNNAIEIVHNEFLSDLFGVSVMRYRGFANEGIDLIGEDVAIEVKNRWSRWTTKNFAIHNYQVSQYKRENPDKELFYVLLNYDLPERITRVSDIKVKEDLEALVCHREAWVIPWARIQRLKVHRTAKSSYRYVRQPQLNNFRGPTLEGEYKERENLPGNTYCIHFPDHRVKELLTDHLPKEKTNL